MSTTQHNSITRMHHVSGRGLGQRKSYLGFFVQNLLSLYSYLTQKYCLNTRSSDVLEMDTFVDYDELNSKPLRCLIVTSL